MPDLTENLDDIFNLCVNETPEGSRKRKLSGKRLMIRQLQRISKRPKWRKQLGAIRAKQTKQKNDSR